jgi:hypothetical protein
MFCFGLKRAGQDVRMWHFSNVVLAAPTVGEAATLDT